MSSFETVLASERIYEGRLINLRVDQIRTAAGVESVREIVEHPGAIALIALDDAGRVLLVKQYRHAVRTVTLEIPAGILELGEEPAAAAQRELREETGYRAERLERLGGIHTAPGFSTEYIHFFMATRLVLDRLAMDDDEVIDLLRLPLADAIDLIRAGQIDDGKTVSGLLLAQAWLNK
ncbi:MAG: NUDIX hydrolase [Thermoflexales bacterium]|nr:NUDIX hydrolase [Thermoflexales bacterium]